MSDRVALWRPSRLRWVLDGAALAALGFAVVPVPMPLDLGSQLTPLTLLGTLMAAAGVVLATVPARRLGLVGAVTRLVGLVLVALLALGLQGGTTGFELALVAAMLPVAGGALILQVRPHLRTLRARLAMLPGVLALCSVLFTVPLAVLVALPGGDVELVRLGVLNAKVLLVVQAVIAVVARARLVVPPRTLGPARSAWTEFGEARGLVTSRHADGLTLSGRAAGLTRRVVVHATSVPPRVELLVAVDRLAGLGPQHVRAFAGQHGDPTDPVLGGLVVLAGPQAKALRGEHEALLEVVHGLGGTVSGGQVRLRSDDGGLLERAGHVALPTEALGEALDALTSLAEALDEAIGSEA